MPSMVQNDKLIAILKQSIRLFKFPSVVLDELFEHMEFKYIFILSTLSKRSSRIVRSCCTKHNLCMLVERNDSLDLIKGGQKSDSFSLVASNKDRVKKRQNILRCEIVTTDRPIVLTYWKNEENSIQILMKHMLEVFPKIKVNLSFYSETEGFLKTIQFLKSLNAQVSIVYIYSLLEDSSVLLNNAIEECQKVRELYLNVTPPSNFDIDFRNKKPLEIPVISILRMEWVTVDCFNHLFINCGHVTLNDGEFGVEDLKKIFHKWIEEAKMHMFAVALKENETLKPIFQEMEGATPLGKAMIRYNQGYEGKKFHNGQAYLLTQNGGTRAIVYRSCGVIYLNTDFNLSNNEDDEEEWSFMIDDFNYNE